MNKDAILRKLSSRKFFALLAGFVGSLLIAFNVSDSDIAQVTAIIGSFGAIAVYILAEASVDRAAIKRDNNEGDA